MVDLRLDGERVRRLWRSNDDLHVPLPLAAALAFHEARSDAHAAVTVPEYEDALNLVAAALSRVVGIYILDERTGLPVQAELNLGTGRFRDGATVYEQGSGRAMTSLVVRREHLPAALGLIKSAGIPFQLGRER